MRLAFEFMAVLCAGFFSGAVLYITLVEHPARMQCRTALVSGQRIWSQLSSSRRKAGVAGGDGLCRGDWRLGKQFDPGHGSSGAVSLWGLSLLPWSVVILPTNKKLLDPSLDRSSEAARRLLMRWGRLHAARTVLGAAAFVVFFIIGVTPQVR